jgi:hypothetical protein
MLHVGLQRYSLLHICAVLLLMCGTACCLLYAAVCCVLLRADVLEWTWFLNSFSDKHIYDFMYGDKDTFGVGFGLAGKAHMYQHMNVPPGEELHTLLP